MLLSTGRSAETGCCHRCRRVASGQERQGVQIVDPLSRSRGETFAQKTASGVSSRGRMPPSPSPPPPAGSRATAACCGTPASWSDRQGSQRRPTAPHPYQPADPAGAAGPHGVPGEPAAPALERGRGPEASRGREPGAFRADAALPTRPATSDRTTPCRRSPSSRSTTPSSR
jgi:hypothetical protein